MLLNISSFSAIVILKNSNIYIIKSNIFYLALYLAPPVAFKMESLLKKFAWPYELKSMQISVITSICERKNVFFVMRTGGGKSDCLILPALMDIHVGNPYFNRKTIIQLKYLKLFCIFVLQTWFILCYIYMVT